MVAIDYNVPASGTAVLTATSGAAVLPLYSDAALTAVVPQPYTLPGAGSTTTLYIRAGGSFEFAVKSSTGATLEAGTGGGSGAVPLVITAVDPSASANLSADYARRATPFGAPARAAASLYDPARFLYGDTRASLRNTRAKLAQARAGVGLFRVVCVGDSLTAGEKATPLTSFPFYLREILHAGGYTRGGTGFVQVRNNGTVADTRWGTISGSWSVFQGKTTQTSFLQATTNAASLTFTSDVAGTIAEVTYLGVSAAFTVSIDGGGAVTVTPDGASALRTYQVTGLSNATHTVTITTTSASAVYIHAAQVRGTTGVLVHNAGIGGANANDWSVALATYYSIGPVTATLPADLAIITLGTNDRLQGRTEAQYLAGMADVIGQFKSSTRDVLLVHPGPANPVDWSAGAITSSTIYAVADAAGVPLLDLNDRWRDYSTQGAAGLMDVDGVHCTAAGYLDRALAACRVLHG